MSKRRAAVVAAIAVVAEVPRISLGVGYPVGGEVVVRCRRGHLFSTIWIPGASIKAVRLGWYRFQRCPVGGHWTLVRPVREAELSDDELRSARDQHDVRLP
jgi:hypothetical protein